MLLLVWLRDAAWEDTWFGINVSLSLNIASYIHWTRRWRYIIQFDSFFLGVGISTKTVQLMLFTWYTYISLYLQACNIYIYKYDYEFSYFIFIFIYIYIYIEFLVAHSSWTTMSAFQGSQNLDLKSFAAQVAKNRYREATNALRVDTQRRSQGPQVRILVKKCLVPIWLWWKLASSMKFTFRVMLTSSSCWNLVTELVTSEVGLWLMTLLDD